MISRPMQISTRVGVVHAMVVSFKLARPEEIRSEVALRLNPSRAGNKALIADLSCADAGLSSLKVLPVLRWAEMAYANKRLGRLPRSLSLSFHSP